MKPDCNCGGIFFCRHPGGWGNYVDVLGAILLGTVAGAIIVTLFMACTSRTIEDCEFICPPGVPIPDGCYCKSDKIRGEINNEAEKLNGKGR